jgi:hypothetical protein|tara:strand:- start:4966 stop:6132 length:1167 start_codon:yes stop_codon:yes gene_type:complete
MAESDDGLGFDSQKYFPVVLDEDISSLRNRSTIIEDDPFDIVDVDARRGRRIEYSSATDNIANQHEAVISLLHLPSGQDLYFKAFITSFNDSIAPSYNEETVFGRTDSIYTYKNTTRNITLNWKIPASTYSEAYENLAKAQKLAQFVYPTYKRIPAAQTISQTSLVRLKVMNLLAKQGSNLAVSSDDAALAAGQERGDLQKFAGYRSNSDSSQGAMGVIKSLTISHNIENPDNGGGVLYLGKNTVLPKLIEVNMSFDVIHENTLGYQNGKFMAGGFPYNTTDGLVPEQTPETLAQFADFNEELQRERQNEADRANALARYSGLGGKARFNKDENRINRLRDKENLSERQQEKLDYLESSRRGQESINKQERAAAYIESGDPEDLLRGI